MLGTISNLFGRVGLGFGRGATDDPTASAEATNDGVQADALDAGSGVTMQEFHARNGVEPSWIFRQPPGVGDAPQHVFATRALAPVSIDGPGDRPATYLRMFTPPIVANFAMRWQGMAVDGGGFLMTGLYAPSPYQQMASDAFAGQVE